MFLSGSTNRFQVTSEHQGSAPNGGDNPTLCFRFLGFYTDETRLKNRETGQSLHACDSCKSYRRSTRGFRSIDLLMHSNTKAFIGA